MIHLNVFVISGLCGGTRCEYGAKCRVSVDRSTSCVCPSCPKAADGDTVCGDDGETYADLCHLEASSCAEKKIIKVAYGGQCGKSSSQFVFVQR